MASIFKLKDAFIHKYVDTKYVGGWAGACACMHVYMCVSACMRASLNNFAINVNEYNRKVQSKFKCINS